MVNRFALRCPPLSKLQELYVVSMPAKVAEACESSSSFASKDAVSTLMKSERAVSLQGSARHVCVLGPCSTNMLSLEPLILNPKPLYPKLTLGLWEEHSDYNPARPVLAPAFAEPCSGVVGRLSVPEGAVSGVCLSIVVVVDDD